jgi:hypothetical protein
VARLPFRRRESGFLCVDGGKPNGRPTAKIFFVFSRRYELNMLAFNYRQSDVARPLRRADDGISFVVRYAAPGRCPSVHADECEKHCPTKSAALNFCVILRNLGGSPIEVLQLIHGKSDAVLDGRDLEEAIDRQRIRLEAEAVPPWR